jgi:RNA polymerase sigma factor (sigma-70 family)
MIFDSLTEDAMLHRGEARVRGAEDARPAPTTRPEAAPNEALPRDLLDLYTKEAKAHDLLTPDEEKRSLQFMIETRNAWMSTFLGTEAAMEELWSDLQRWKAGEIAASSIVAGPPKLEPGQVGPQQHVERLHTLFVPFMKLRGERPFRVGKGRNNRLLLREVFHLGLRTLPLQRYREVALAQASPATEEKIQRAHERFIEARRPLIEHNLRLVLKAARAFVPGPLPYNELVQEGNLGLIRATESFNDRFGVRFSTYAYLWIRQSIIRALENNSRTIRLPVSLTQHLRQLTQKNEQAGPEGDGEAKERLDRLLANPSVSGTVLSLDYGPDDSAPLGEALPDEEETSPGDPAATDDLRVFVREALHVLPERQRLVLRLRFGIGVSRPHSLSEIGRLLGLSAERIRQIQQIALEQLRKVPIRACSPRW